MAATRVVSQDIKDGTIALGDLGCLTTKGDLLTRTSTTAARQAVGANNRVLTADSSQTNGIGWSVVGTVTNAVRGIFGQTATVTISNTTTETTLVGSGTGSVTIPASQMGVGSTVVIRAAGIISTSGSAVNLRLRAKLGSTTIADSGANSGFGTTSLTDKAWGLYVMLTCRTTGGSGTVFGQGFFLTGRDADTQYREVLNIEGSSAVTVDTTASQAVDLTAAWGTASASNNLRCTNLLVTYTDPALLS